MMGGSGNTASASDSRPPREKYANELSQIKEMGFNDEEVILQALVQCNGNVSLALERLFSQLN
jgi:ubiquilin